MSDFFTCAKCGTPLTDNGTGLVCPKCETHHDYNGEDTADNGVVIAAEDKSHTDNCDKTLGTSSQSPRNLSPYGIEDAKRDLAELGHPNRQRRVLAFIEQQAAEIEALNLARVQDAEAYAAEIEAYKPAGATIKRLMHENDALRAEIERLEQTIEWYKGNPMSDDEYEQFRQRFPLFLMRLQSAESDRDHYKAMAEWLARRLSLVESPTPLSGAFNLNADGEANVPKWMKVAEIQVALQAASEAVKP